MEPAEQEHRRQLEAEAHRLGFHKVGVAAAGRSRHADRYLAWLDAGRHASMGYLEREVARRVDPRETVPDARSVIVVTFPYQSEVEVPDDPARGKIARYARGRDYHKVMTPRLAALARFVAGDAPNDPHPPQDPGAPRRTWYTVDTAPILERDWAEAAGIGWIGRNALVIDREIGSYFFLGVVVTDREYAPDPPATDHCGTCRACLDVCPTDAFVGERSVDARRCISYLTIEHRGEIDSTLADKLEGWVFGCDLCQEVCPYNNRHARVLPAIDDDLTPRELPDRLDQLSALDRESFLASFAGTPITRTGHERLARNARLNANARGTST